MFFPVLFMSPFPASDSHIKVSPEPSLHQAEQTPLSQTFLMEEVEERGRTTSLDFWPCFFWGSLGFSWWLMSSLSSTSTPKSFLALNPHILQSVFIPGVATIQMQYLALHYVASHKDPMDPLLEIVEVTEDDISSFRSITAPHSSQNLLCFVCKIAQGALNPTLYIIEDNTCPSMDLWGTQLNTDKSEDILNLLKNLTLKRQSFHRERFLLLGPNTIIGSYYNKALQSLGLFFSKTCFICSF